MQSKQCFHIIFILFTLLVLLVVQADAFGETVDFSHCFNRCSGIGKCVNNTLQDSTTLQYDCLCGYESKFPDCSDQAYIPILWTIILAIFILVVFGVTFTLFERCNKAFDAGQKFYSPNSVLVR